MISSAAGEAGCPARASLWSSRGALKMCPGCASHNRVVREQRLWVERGGRVEGWQCAALEVARQVSEARRRCRSAAQDPSEGTGKEVELRTVKRPRVPLSKKGEGWKRMWGRKSLVGPGRGCKSTSAGNCPETGRKGWAA